MNDHIKTYKNSIVSKQNDICHMFLHWLPIKYVGEYYFGDTLELPNNMSYQYNMKYLLYQIGLVSRP